MNYERAELTLVADVQDIVLGNGATSVEDDDHQSWKALGATSGLDD